MVAEAKRPPPWQNLVHVQKYFKGFHLAGVTMGMTPNLVRELHPQFALIPDSPLESRGQFVSAQTPYSVWFAKMGGQSMVYKIRFHKRYLSQDENEALGEFGRKLGRPLTTSCYRSQLAASAKTCVFKWLRNGIDVTLVSKLIRFSNVAPRTYVTITATDTHLAAKQRRQTAQQTNTSHTR